MTDREAGDFFFEDFHLGQAVERHVVLTEAALDAFARLTGDYSPLHVDEEFARRSRYGRRVAHGMLTASYLTGIFGMDLPARNGLFMGQTLSYRKPVFLGDELHYRVAIVHLDEAKLRLRLSTQCHARGELVLDGEALIFVPRRPASLET